ncbi:MAG: hypothetical protein WAK31_16065 [Chthoniobacterales bacterium]
MTIIHDLHWLAHKLVKRAKVKLPPVSEVIPRRPAQYCGVNADAEK